MLSRIQVTRVKLLGQLKSCIDIWAMDIAAMSSGLKRNLKVKEKDLLVKMYTDIATPAASASRPKNRNVPSAQSMEQSNKDALHEHKFDSNQGLDTLSQPRPAMALPSWSARYRSQDEANEANEAEARRVAEEFVAELMRRLEEEMRQREIEEQNRRDEQAALQQKERDAEEDSKSRGTRSADWSLEHVHVMTDGDLAPQNAYAAQKEENSDSPASNYST